MHMRDCAKCELPLSSLTRTNAWVVGGVALHHVGVQKVLHAVQQRADLWVCPSSVCVCVCVAFDGVVWCRECCVS